MARRRMAMTDILEMLVAWDAGEGPSAISARLGYSRPTVRKYTDAARALGLTRGGQRRSEADWVALTTAVLAVVAKQRVPGAVTATLAAYDGYLAARPRRREAQSDGARPIRPLSS